MHDALNDVENAVAIYKKVLNLDSVNAEATASLASHHFYNDQPEIALRLYSRLLQMGLASVELWNNLGLCCFYASQVSTKRACVHKECACGRTHLFTVCIFF